MRFDALAVLAPDALRMELHAEGADTHPIEHHEARLIGSHAAEHIYRVTVPATRASFNLLTALQSRWKQISSNGNGE